MRLRWLIAILCVFGAISPGSQARALSKPFLWKACDSDSCVFLLGTFHALKHEDVGVAPEVKAAQSESDRFFFEVDPAETKDPMHASMAFLQAALRTDGSRLDDDLTPALQRKLAAVIARHGQQARALDLLNGEGRQQLDLWYVALLLSLSGLERGDLDPEFGLDRQMERRLVDATARIHGLESVADQVAVFDGLGKKEQLQLLEESLDQFNKGPAEFSRLRKAWLSGDAAAAWALLGATTKKAYPELYRRLQTDRNRRWTERIEKTLAEMKDGNAMVIVGTLHLLGEDSLVAMLERKGYRVARICADCRG